MADSIELHTVSTEYKLGVDCFNQSQFREAIEHFLIIANKASDPYYPAACLKLWYIYTAGLGVRIEGSKIEFYAKAMADMTSWFIRQAESGDADAQFNLGVLYHLGLGEIIPQNYKQAMIWYGKAAAQGYVFAQNNIGWMWEYGLGVSIDYGKAAEYYAAPKEFAVAQKNLGWLYHRGLGVPLDYDAAMQLYLKAAKREYSFAQNCIGWMFQNGHGVAPNLEEAAKWYNLAAAQGCTLAESNLLSLEKVKAEAAVSTLPVAVVERPKPVDTIERITSIESSRIFKGIKHAEELRYSYKTDREINVHGHIDAQSGGHVSTSHDVVSYTITVTYEGPVDIGERVIRRKTVPDYWNSASLWRTAERETGITCCVPNARESDLSICDWACGILFFCTLPCKIWICVQNPRYDELDRCRDQLANGCMERDVRNLVIESDELVDERIIAKQQERQEALTFLRQQVAQPGLSLPLPMTTQYQTRSKAHVVEVVSPIALGEIPPPPAYTYSPSAPPL